MSTAASNPLETEASSFYRTGRFSDSPYKAVVEGTATRAPVEHFRYNHPPDSTHIGRHKVVKQSHYEVDTVQSKSAVGLVPASSKDQAKRMFLLFPSKANGRLKGPVQFILQLLEHWGLQRGDAYTLLGFEDADAARVEAVLNGIEEFRGRDVNDRITYLFYIRQTLHSLFRNLRVENEWLRESHDLLDGRSPLDLLLGGSMEDLLLLREYVDTAAGR